MDELITKTKPNWATPNGNSLWPQISAKVTLGHSQLIRLIQPISRVTKKEGKMNTKSRTYPTLLQPLSVTNTSKNQQDPHEFPRLEQTYHSLIESPEITQTIINSIKSITHPTNDSPYKAITKIGVGQFSKVYKMSNVKTNQIFAMKLISKKPQNSSQYSMNQIMKWIQRNKQYYTHDGDDDGAALTTDEIIMLMNIQKCRWEIFVWVYLSRNNNRYNNIVRLIQCFDDVYSSDICIINEFCNLGELLWKRDYTSSTMTTEVNKQWLQLIGQDDNEDAAAKTRRFALKVLWDMAHALKFLFDMGCIHRDIKPQNILCDSVNRCCKISDFGCSVIIPDKLPFQDSYQEKNPSLLMKCFQMELNKIVGTPAFIPPELCHFGKDPTDEDIIGNDIQMSVDSGFKLDTWSLGVTIYCLLYNDLPFCGDNEFDAYHKIVTQSLSSKLNGELLNDLIIMHLLEKDPKKRIHINTLLTVLKQDQDGTIIIDMDAMSKVPEAFTNSVTMKEHEFISEKGTKEKNLDKKKKENKSVQKFFQKLFKSSKNSKNSKNSTHKKDSVMEETKLQKQTDGIPIQKEEFNQQLPISPIGSVTSSLESSFDEPVQLLDFRDAKTAFSYDDCVYKLANEEHNHDGIVTPHNTTKDDSSLTKRKSTGTTSSLSLSPIKIATPIKNLIRIKTTPQRTQLLDASHRPSLSNSPLKNKQPSNQIVHIVDTQSSSFEKGLTSSRNILNFQKYFQNSSSRANNDSQETVQEIREYLDYADQ
ncbi:serine/threonine protein kinase ELM1 NDAI_0C00570 [Naumovozyma dairenensis CBS 421]|uniref:non-specific serine/threonine protein kinase n=1 Tax=Naumovozyma dairenensis (strain ATCC 10597 / BCRC 20456 / CBS 421 / NBRC 0211 / NRRL Y-12639) TaxID=1071378 RepID=G0W7F7_NAUDC|nr:hypothetical protein NDAI_0C00570 [Naumovozyma dairenensis CBS 421]CCD23718.1 hypothetical protein NDAI_0C00570 [Naumovozyma dairenensis CBS 421]